MLSVPELLARDFEVASLMHRFDALPKSAFARLRQLLEGLEPGMDPITLSLGSPREPFPDFVAEALSQALGGLGPYPPAQGSDALRRAIVEQLNRRYGLDPAWLDPDRHIQPVCGSREGLFNIGLCVVPERKAGGRPVVLMPNPFYQVYGAAALAAGAEPVYVAADKSNGFLPDYAGLDGDILERTAALYFCSPANPQGACADMVYLKTLIALAQRHDFTLIIDECYADIYDAAAPTGLLEAAAELGGDLRRLLVFQSLSKRSSLAGMRSGFCAGDADIIARFLSFRNVAAAQMPGPIQAASAAAWRDQGHVAKIRGSYRAKIDLAENILGNRFGFYRPAGGFFLWLDVAALGGGEAAARQCWRDAGVMVLPGAYLSQQQKNEDNPGADYIRVALVEEKKRTGDALQRLAGMA